MSVETVEVLPDPANPRGGHAIIRLKGLWLLPPGATFRIEPADGDTSFNRLRGWPRGDQRPRATRVTGQGLELLVGPEIVDSPDLQPGTHVRFRIPSLDLDRELEWPSLPMSRHAFRRSLSAASQHPGRVTKSPVFSSSSVPKPGEPEPEPQPGNADTQAARAAGRPQKSAEIATVLSTLTRRPSLAGQSPADNTQLPPANDVSVTASGASTDATAPSQLPSSQTSSQTASQTSYETPPTVDKASETTDEARSTHAHPEAGSAVPPPQSSPQFPSPPARTFTVEAMKPNGAGPTASIKTAVSAPSRPSPPEVPPAIPPAVVNSLANPPPSAIPDKPTSRLQSEAELKAVAEAELQRDRERVAELERKAAREAEEKRIKARTANMPVVAKSAPVTTPEPANAPSQTFAAAMFMLLMAALMIPAILAASGVKLNGPLLGQSGSPQPAPDLAALGRTFAVGDLSPAGISASDVTASAALEAANRSLYGLDGTVRDRREAEFWLRTALSRRLDDAGITWALTQLGTIYGSPSGEAKADFDKARLLWEIAAAHDDALANCFLGRLNEYGLGSPVNKAAALDYYRKSKSLGGSDKTGCTGLDQAIARLKMN